MIEEVALVVIAFTCGIEVVPPFGRTALFRYGIKLSIKRIMIIRAAPTMNMNLAPSKSPVFFSPLFGSVFCT